MPTSTFDLATLALVYVLPVDSLTLVFANLEDATAHTLTFGAAESDSTVDLPAVRQTNGYGLSEHVCHRLLGTLFFPFNDLGDATLLGAFQKINDPLVYRLDSLTLDFAHYGEAGLLSVSLANGLADSVGQIGCVAELEPHPERGLRMKVTVEGIFSLPFLTVSTS